MRERLKQNAGTTLEADLRASVNRRTPHGVGAGCPSMRTVLIVAGALSLVQCGKEDDSTMADDGGQSSAESPASGLVSASDTPTTSKSGQAGSGAGETMATPTVDVGDDSEGDGVGNSFFVADAGLEAAADDAGVACGGTELQASSRAVNLLLVIDKSGSMNGQPEGFEVTKWEALQSALERLSDELSQEVALGLDLFPDERGGTIATDCTDNCCTTPSSSEPPSVPIDRSLGELDASESAGFVSNSAVAAGLAASSPGGGTPVAAALARAHEYFTSGNGADLPGDRFVVLATDGGPNCNDALGCEADSCTVNMLGNCPDGINCCGSAIPGGPTECLDAAASVDQVEALRGSGVDTIVLGIPGSEAFANVLDLLAQAGGRPQEAADTDYFAVSASGGSDELVQTLRRIAEGLITTCRLQLESEPSDPNKLNVEIDGEWVPQSGDDGWQYDTQGEPAVVLKGELCERVRSKGAREVSIVFGCPTIF